MDFLGEKKVEFMQDIALATGGFFISENTGGKLDEIGIEQLGGAESVVISRDETTIIGGDKKTDEFEKLLTELKKQEEAEEDTDLKELLRKRIARLNSSVAVLSVGGVTEVEMEEKLDRVDDATRAVKCAIEEGYLPGSGVSFFNCQDTGNEVVDSVLKKPLEQICENSAVDFISISRQLKDKENNKGKASLYHSGMGYNAKSGQVENLLKAGVLEPVKSNRCALQNAASVVNQILSSQYMITDSL
jgi:chaperonin GroEL